MASIDHQLPENDRPFARNSAYGVGAGLIGAGGMFLANIIIAHQLGVEGTGVVAYAVWAAAIGAAVADLGTQYTLGRYLPELAAQGNAGAAEGLVRFLRCWVALSSGIVAGAFVAYGLWDSGAGDGRLEMWTLAGAVCAAQTISGFCCAMLRGFQRFDRLMAITALATPGQFVAIALGSMLFGVPGGLLGYCVGHLIVMPLFFRRIRGGQRISSSLKREVIRYAVYSWAAVLSSTLVWSRAELFFLQRAAGNTAVGLFAVGITLANVASRGPTLLTSALLPHFAQRFGRGSTEELRRGYASATRFVALIALPCCFGTAALLPIFIPLIYGPAFAAAVPATTVMLLAAGIGSTSSVGTSLIMASGRSDFHFISGAICAALVIFAGLTVIPMYGLIGAAYARAAIQTGAVALGSFFVFFRLGFPIPFRDLSKLLVAAALCGASMRFVLAVVNQPFCLPAAITTGFLVYAIAVRLLQALPADDVLHLQNAGTLLPYPLRSGFAIALRLFAATPVAGEGSGVTAATAAPNFSSRVPPGAGDGN